MHVHKRSHFLTTS